MAQRNATHEARITSIESKLEVLITAVTNLAALVTPIVTQSEAPQVAPTTSAKAKTPHQLMGEANEVAGRMYTARYTCTTEGCTNKTGFYKVESAQAHAERKVHTYKAIEFAS